MDLVDRYLQAIKFWLPKAQKEDIVAELSVDIHSHIEEQEAKLGRKLNESEVGAMLKSRGRPVLVAQRYLPQEFLVGPTLFPVYRFVLKIVTACYLVPWILVWLGFMIYSPAFRAAHTGATWIETLGIFWGRFWVVALITLGAVTVIFAVLERIQAKSGFLEKWDPLKLPAVRDPNQIPRSESILELAICVVFGTWWISAMRSPVVLDQPGVQIILAPAWTYFFWGYLLLMLAAIAASGVNLFRPYWTRQRAGIRLLTNGIGSVMFCALCRSEILAKISLTDVSPARTLEITNAINLWMSRAFPFVVGLGLVILAFDIRRIIRVKTDNYRLPKNMAAGGLPTSAAG